MAENSPTLVQSLVLERAINLALRAHRGQKDKHGNHYILHILRVVADNSLTTDEERILAALHDVIEDTYIKSVRQVIVALPVLKAYPDILVALDLITRKPEHDYYGYIHRLAPNKLARSVKIADINDHLTPPLPIENTLIRRYERARHKLLNWKQ